MMKKKLIKELCFSNDEFLGLLRIEIYNHFRDIGILKDNHSINIKKTKKGFSISLYEDLECQNQQEISAQT